MEDATVRKLFNVDSCEKTNCPRKRNIGTGNIVLVGEVTRRYGERTIFHEIHILVLNIV